MNIYVKLISLVTITHYNGGTISSVREIYHFIVLTMEFISICAKSTLSEHLFSIGLSIIIFKRGRLALETMLILMTLRCWALGDDIDFEVETLFE